MKLHFYDDSIDNAACGVNSNFSTSTGSNVTCCRCKKIVGKMHIETLAGEKVEQTYKRTLHAWAN